MSIAALTWSSAYASIAYALAAFTPGQLAFARLLLAAGLFQGSLRLRGIALPPGAAWPPMLALGVVGLAAYHLALNVAEMRVASGTAAILIALIPGATAVVSALWLRERLAARTVLGLAIALGGVGLVVISSGHRLHFQPRALLVLVSVLAAALRRRGAHRRHAHRRRPRGGAVWPGDRARTARRTGAASDGIAVARVRADLPRLSHLESRHPPSERHPGVELHLLLLAARGPDRVVVARGAPPGALTLAGGALVIGGVILANLRRGSAPAALES